VSYYGNALLTGPGLPRITCIEARRFRGSDLHACWLTLPVIKLVHAASAAEVQIKHTSICNRATFRSDARTGRFPPGDGNPKSCRAISASVHASLGHLNGTLRKVKARGRPNSMGSQIR
jgi:hypothetical protein